MSPLRSLRIPLLFAAITGTLYCGGSDSLTVPSEGLPSEIAIAGGNGQLGIVGQPLADPLAVRLTDSKDRPVSGQKVEFRVVTGGSSAGLSPDTATTNNDGTARSQWVLGGSAGVQTVQARVISAVAHGALSATFTATASAQAPDTVFAVAGEDQTGVVNGPLADSLVVVVRDEFGNPLANQTVTWTVPDGQGSVSAHTTITDDAGRAAVARTLGPMAGTQTAQATTTGLANEPVIFEHTAVSGNAARLVALSPDNQSALAGTRLPDSLVVQAFDADGNAASGAVITWVPSSGSSATPTSSTTDQQGKAFTFWTLSSTPGANTLTAAGFGSTVVYHATGTAAGPTQIVFGQQPTSGPAGAVISPAVTVILQDGAGNTVTSSSATVTVRLNSGSGGANLGGTLSVAAVNGVATFPDLSVDAAGTGYTLVAMSPGLAELSSLSFDITQVTPPTLHLDFSGQPSNVNRGEVMAPPVRVRVLDEANHVYSQATGAITLALGSNPLGLATLNGTLTVVPQNGVAIFDDLAVTGLTLFNNLTLIAQSAGMDAVESKTFDVN